jgi:excinuclease ABC subunit A
VFTGLSGSGKSRWRSTPSTPRASAATSSRCRPTPASSSARWTSPTSTSSRACRRPSPSTRSRPAATPLHGRHRHRGLRLPPPAVRPHRRPALPRDGRGRSPARPPADRRPVLELPEGTRFQVLAPVVRGRKGNYETLLADLRGPGLRPRPDRRRAARAAPRRRSARARPLRGAPHRGGRRPPGEARRHRASAHRVAGDGAGLAEGVAEVELVPKDDEEPNRDPDVLPAPGLPGRRQELRGAGAPQLLVQLALRRLPERCDGLGTQFEVDPELVVPDPDADPGRGRDLAVGRWPRQYFQRLLESVCAEHGHPDINTPWSPISRPSSRRLLLYGATAPARSRSATSNRYGRTRTYTPPSRVPSRIQRRHADTEADSQREQFEGYMREVPCPACEGARLKPLHARRHRSTASTSTSCRPCLDRRRGRRLRG